MQSDRIINEREIGKGVTNRPWYATGLYCLTVTINHLSHDSCYPSRDLKWVPPTYKPKCHSLKHCSYSSSSRHRQSPRNKATNEKYGLGYFPAHDIQSIDKNIHDVADGSYQLSDNNVTQKT